MIFPEFLFRLLPGDQGTQQLGIVYRESVTSQLAALVSTTAYTVPNDKVLILLNVVARSLAGAAQVSQRRRIFADPPQGDTRYELVNNEVNSAAGGAVTENWQHQAFIPGGWKVKAETTFSAFANANSVALEIHGILIPRGTFVFG